MSEAVCCQGHYLQHPQRLLPILQSSLILQVQLSLLLLWALSLLEKQCLARSAATKPLKLPRRFLHQQVSHPCSFTCSFTCWISRESAALAGRTAVLLAYTELQYAFWFGITSAQRLSQTYQQASGLGC